MHKYYGLLIGIVFSLILIDAMFNTKPKRKRSAGRKKLVKPIKAKASSVNVHHKLSDAELMNANIDTLSGTDFERLMAMYYTDKGYRVQIIGGSGDFEVDLVMIGKEGYKIAVQCKRWNGNVGSDTVLRLKAGKQIHGCYDAWIVTTSYFTKDAITSAERLNIKLINGAQTHDMIYRWRKNKKGAFN